MPFGIKAMSLTETAHHITGRNLVLVTTENKVYTLKEQQYSARRPDPPKPDVTPTSVKGVMDQLKEEMNEEERKLREPQLKSDKFPAYDAIIAESATRYITYNMPLVDLRQVMTLTTRLESTTQVFAYGHDLVLARIKPDNKFDLLDDSFNYSFLGIAIVTLYTANFIFSKYMKRASAKKAFLTI